MLAQILRENGTNDYFGRYLIEEKKNGALVGVAKLEAYGEEVEIGYRIMEEYWGKGVATEIAKALLVFAIRKFQPPAVVAFKCGKCGLYKGFGKGWNEQSGANRRS